jgi:hypothetical protein
MPLSEALERELDAHLERTEQAREDGEPAPGPPGTVRVEQGGVTLEAEVVDCERIGATVDRVRVRQEQPGDVPAQARAIAERMHGLGERVQPVEVEPSLGGAVLRTRPEDMVEGRFYEISVGDEGRQAEIERFAVGDEGQREREPFAVTRENLGRVVDGLAEGLGASGETS